MSIEFLTALGDVKQLPKLLQSGLLAGRRWPRLVVAGRSNAGKSTLINCLSGTDAAHVSKEPGKTRKVNIFEWRSSSAWVLVDLPGYGYAKRSPAERDLWEVLIDGYLQADKAGIKAILLLSDCRHGPAESDWSAWQYFRTLGVEVILVMTKSDTLNRQERVLKERELQAALVARDVTDGNVAWVHQGKNGMSPLFQILRAMR